MTFLNQAKKIVLFAGLFSVSTAVSKAKELPSLTVFIHGTVAPYLAFTSPSWFLRGEVADDAYYSTLLRKARKSSLSYENHPMLEEGFIEIRRQKIEDTRTGDLSPQEARLGIYYLVSGYDAIGQFCGHIKKNHQYAAFGWSGMNSIRARKEAAKELYDRLVERAPRYKDIHIISYSHGSNAVLEMDKVEEKKKKNLKIKTFSMIGTPIQVETVAGIASTMFESIVAFRSDGDNVQKADMFSTEIGTSFSKMKHLINLERIQNRYPSFRRADVRFILNDDRYLIDHFNMYMVGSTPSHKDLGKLPMAVFVPLILSQLLPQKNLLEAEAHISVKKNQIVTYIRPENNRVWRAPGDASANIHHLIKDHCTLLDTYWRPIIPKAIEDAKKAYKSIKDLVNALKADKNQ